MRLVLFGAAVALLSTAAGAQSVDRVVAFGDSYADNGNLRRIAGPLFPNTLYPTGRFSGGTNFVDTLADIYGAEQVNFAVGGSRAGPTNVVLPGLPGFEQQWRGFAASGATFAETDLLALSVGGNDARGYRVSGTLAGADAAAAATAAQATAGIQALVARGARRMVFIVGDTGQLPEAIGRPSAAIGTAFSTAYNADMQASLAPIAASGVTVAYTDITAIGNVVRADPARFGFVDVVTACPQACVGDPALQSRYFFYTDQVHLTSSAFALVGRYAANILAAPYSFRMNGDLPQHAARQFGQSMNTRLDLARGAERRPGLSAYASFTADRRRRDADAGANGYEIDSKGAQGGLEYGLANGTVGAMFSWTRGRARGIDQDRARANSYQIGGYATAERGPFFGQIYGGHGWHDLDIRRTGVADPLTASPNARSWTAGGRLGALARVGAFRIGPVVGVDYARSRTQAYVEAGDGAAAQIVSRQRIDTLTGSAGAELRYDRLAGASPWLRVTAEKDFDRDGRGLSYAVVTAPGIVNGFRIAGGSKRAYGAATGGYTATLAGRLSLDVGVRATFARIDGNEATGFGGLRLGL